MGKGGETRRQRRHRVPLPRTEKRLFPRLSSSNLSFGRLVCLARLHIFLLEYVIMSISSTRRSAGSCSFNIEDKEAVNSPQTRQTEYARCNMGIKGESESY